MTLFDMARMTQASAAEPTILPGQWRLARIELVNWGTFPGHTSVDVARKGHLITGASGSGKSSLLDAIATVLTPGRWLKLNAAAQDAGSRTEDRSLVSYVRGAWKKEADAVEDRAVASYLRTGATWSGILLVFDNGQGDRVSLTRLFHLRAGTDEATALKSAAIADRGDAKLLDFAPFVASGIDARKLKTTRPAATVTTSSHGEYFVRLRKLLGISSDNALLLLHKTQSAKNLSSLDHLFRSFMLDRPTTFERAANAVEQFTELNDAHRLVVDAREQLAALRALDPHIATYEKASGDSLNTERLIQLQDQFEQRLLIEVTEEELADARARHPELEARAAAASEGSAAAGEARRLAERRVDQLGGSELERLREKADGARDDEARVRGDWERLHTELGRVGMRAPATAAEFGELRETARRELESHDTTAKKLHDYDENVVLADAKSQMHRIDEEIRELEQRRSNVPPALLFARKTVAAELGVAEAALPFAGELIEVVQRHSDWTGAIERVLRPLAVTMLVRDEHLPAVRRIADSRHLGARLRYEAVAALVPAPRPARDERSLLNRVVVTQSSFADWLSWALAERFDVACVEHPDDLDRVERGVTRAGQVKAAARRYEKNDVDRIDDRTKWVLGADNAAKIAALTVRRREAEERAARADATLTRLQEVRENEQRRRGVLERFLDLQWARIDTDAAARVTADRLAEYTAAATGSDELRDAGADLKAARQRVDTARRAEVEAVSALQSLDREISTLADQAERLAAEVAATSIDAVDFADLHERYRAVQRRLDRARIPEVGRKVGAALSQAHSAALRRAGDAKEAFALGASAFKQEWQTVAADLEPTIDDRAGFRALRTEIESRGLPEYEERFLQLLRDKSRELIAYLLRDIREAPKLVRERIDPVNESLSRSEFDRGRHLKIRVKEQRSGEVERFLTDLRRIAEGSWGDEEIAQAEERFVVLEGVMRRLGSSTHEDVTWRQRVLDTREHVTFQAQELDALGEVVNVHDSSAGLSGGQRQKLVIFCLAAALRYQLTRDDVETPAYATIVLDEAFDKADAAFTRMALDVFDEFGFHLLLATPQKLLTTIEPYVGAITSIANPTRSHSRVANVAIEEAPGMSRSGTGPSEDATEEDRPTESRLPGDERRPGDDAA